MKLNFSKTIFIIVFVVFLGIFKASNVDAYYAQCYYESNEGYAILSINDTFSKASLSRFYRYNGTGNVFLSVDNWTASQSASRASNIGYNGYDDAWNNDRCPEYLVVGTNVSYVSDSEHLEAAKNYMTGISYVMQLKVHTFPNSSVGGNISYKICECDENIFYNIAEKRNLVSLSGSGGSSIQNWGSVVDKSIKFVGIMAATNNSCPNIIKSSKGNYITDEANKTAIINKVNGTELKCEVSRSTPAETIINKPEYNNPSVNTDIIKPFEKGASLYSCGNLYINDIPSTIPRITSLIYNIFQVIVPVALVILGMLDLVKAITSQKEDEIKKGQQTFIKRLIAAAIIFFIFALVKLAVSLFSSDTNDVVDCMSCFLQGTDNCD